MHLDLNLTSSNRNPILINYFDYDDDKSTIRKLTSIIQFTLFIMCINAVLHNFYSTFRMMWWWGGRRKGKYLFNMKII